MKIGVFDSGVGGLSVANAIQEALPESEILYTEDRENVPYGTKTPEELYELVCPILSALAGEGCDVIVIACNTVTTTLIDKLREEIATPLIGMEPMVKPAASLTSSGVIAVCATPVTLGSKRYDHLKQTHAKDITVLEPDCSDWAYLIEHNSINDKHIRDIIEPVLEQGADVIVLGCTHYHWIEEEISELAAGRAQVLQPVVPVIKEIKRTLGQLA